MYPELIKFQNIKKNLQVINLGTGMGYYDFCYDECSVQAFNFSLPQQNLQFDYKLLKQYADYCLSGCKVCIVLPFPIFCAHYFDELQYVYERYYSILPRDEVAAYCKSSYEEYKSRIEKEGIKGELALYNPLSESEMERQSQAAIREWEGKLPIVSCMSGQLKPETASEMAKTKKWLRKLLELCRCRQFSPYIIVPPMSRVLLDKMSHEFRKAYFYDCLDEVTGGLIPILDYSDNERFCNPKLYGWPGFLINKAAKKFTEDVLAEIDVA